MSVFQDSSSRKWIVGLLAIVSLIISYVVLAFLNQMNEWFALESKMASFQLAVMSISIVLGVASFLFSYKNGKIIKYLEEVYSELTKVVWSDKDSTIKLTVGIMIGVTITSILLGIVDFIIGKLLGLLY